MTVSYHNSTYNIPFSLSCNVRAELDGYHLNTTIRWIRISPESNTTSQMEEVLTSFRCIPEIQANFSYLFFNGNNSGCEYELGFGSGISSSSPSVLGYQSVLNTTENGTDTVVTYRCQATIMMNITSFSDITVYVKGMNSFITI